MMEKPVLLILAIITLALLSSCALHVTSDRLIEEALYYLDKCPYRHTGHHAPPQTPKQKKTEERAKTFIAKHPSIAMKAARMQMAEDKSREHQALHFLAFHKHPAFELIFLEQLKRRDFSNQDYAHIVIGYLGEIRSTKAVPYLIQLQNKKVHSSVIRALAQIGDLRAVSFLCEVVADDTTYSWDKRRAVKALGEMKDKRAVQPLCDILEKRKNLNGSVRAEAALALADIGDRSALPVLKRVGLKTSTPRQDRAPLVAILLLDPESAAQTIKDTNNVYLAKYLEAADAVPWLLEVFNDPHNNYHPQAALQLAKLGVKEIIPRIKRDLRKPQAISRRYVVNWRRDYLEALFLLGDPEATELGVELGKKDAWAMISLAYHGSKEALPLYRTYLTYNNRFGFIGVCRTGSAEDAKSILDYCYQVPWSGKRIETAFEDLSAPHFPPSKDMPFAIDFFVRHQVIGAKPLLRKWIIPYDRQVCVVRALGEIGDDSDATWLVDKIAKNHFYCNEMGFAAADAIVRLGDRSLIPDLRTISNGQSIENSVLLAMYTLYQFGETDTRKQLREWFRNGKEDWHRLRIADVLCRLHDDAAYDYLLNLAQDDGQEKHDRILALEQLKRLKVRHRHIRLVEGLALTESVEVRKAAFRCLSKCGNRKTLRFLKDYPIGLRFDVLDELMGARKELMSKYSKDK